MTRKRVLEIVIEIAIAVAIVAIIAASAIYVPKDFWPEWISFRIIVFTAFTFGYPLKMYRRYWRRAPFWAAFLALLTAHLVFFTLYLRTLAALWLWLLTPVEWIVIYPALEAAGNDSSPDDSNETRP